MKKLIVLSILGLMVVAGNAFAYDATFNFSHPAPALAAGFRIKVGSVKGGPYPTVIQCGKPAVKTDGTYDCIGTGLNLDPMYAIAVAYDSANQESPPSNEATYDPAPPAPAGLKYTISGTVTITPTN